MTDLEKKMKQIEVLNEKNELLKSIFTFQKEYIDNWKEHTDFKGITLRFKDNDGTWDNFLSFSHDTENELAKRILSTIGDYGKKLEDDIMKLKIEK
jgi:hypothetical protein